MRRQISLLTYMDMKKSKFFLPVLMIVVAAACSRSGRVDVPVKYQGVAEKLVAEFNGQRFGNIYEMYSDSVRAVLAKEGSESSLRFLYAQTGKIQKLTFERSMRLPNSPDSVALFRIDIEKSAEPLSISIALDSAKQFTDLSFLPYVKDGIPYVR